MHSHQRYGWFRQKIAYFSYNEQIQHFQNFYKLRNQDIAIVVWRPLQIQS